MRCYIERLKQLLSPDLNDVTKLMVMSERERERERERKREREREREGGKV